LRGGKDDKVAVVSIDLKTAKMVERQGKRVQTENRAEQDPELF
jgi:hypothetical protein